jgi:hypothetical protein
VDTLLDVLLFLAVALLGYLTGQRFPHLGGRVGQWVGRYRGATARPPGPWRRWSRLLAVAGALAATAPVWPVIQPGDPVADEMLQPAEVAVIVPVVLAFPVAWALLGRSRPYARRVAIVLDAGVAGWSLWTVRYGTYDTPPNIDDGLRWYLVGTAVIVASATVIEAWRRGIRQQLSRRWAAGVLVWMVGVAATFAIPVVGDKQEKVPPHDAILPLPPTVTVVREGTGCARPEFGPRFCFRRFTVAATDGADRRELARRISEHLRTKGWPAAWDDTSTGQSPCQPIGWFNPYELCVELRPDESGSTAEVELAYYNERTQVVY